MVNSDPSVRPKPFIMELCTNSIKVKHFSLSFEEDSINNRHIKEDSKQNGTKRRVSSRQWIIIILYFVLILSVTCFGLVIVLLDESCYEVSNMSYINTCIDRSSPNNNMTDCKILDEVLLGERRARLEAVKSRQLTQEQKTFWSRIHLAWMTTCMPVDSLDVNIIYFMMVLSVMKKIVGNATQELKDEGFELLHDLFLEEHQSETQTDESMDWMSGLRSFSENIPNRRYSPAFALKSFNALGEGFNLFYQKIEVENSKKISNKFVIGKFVYRGEDPEKSYVRNVRHILNAIVRLLLKIEDPSAMRTLCGDTKFETKPKKAENILFHYIKESLKYSDNLYSSSSARKSARRRKRSSILKPADLMEDPNLITSKRFQSSMEMFFDKMEILASHIDRLHERYMTLNELNDDYISREFSVESDLTDDRKI